MTMLHKLLSGRTSTKRQEDNRLNRFLNVRKNWHSILRIRRKYEKVKKKPKKLIERTKEKIRCFLYRAWSLDRGRFSSSIKRCWKILKTIRTDVQFTIIDYLSYTRIFSHLSNLIWLVFDGNFVQWNGNSISLSQIRVMVGSPYIKILQITLLNERVYICAL